MKEEDPSAGQPLALGKRTTTFVSCFLFQHTTIWSYPGSQVYLSNVLNTAALMRSISTENTSPAASTDTDLFAPAETTRQSLSIDIVLFVSQDY